MPIIMFILRIISIRVYLWFARQTQDIFVPLRNLPLQDMDCWNRHSHKWNSQDYHWCDWHPNRLKQRDSLLYGITRVILLIFFPSLRNDSYIPSQQSAEVHEKPVPQLSSPQVRLPAHSESESQSPSSISHGNFSVQQLCSLVSSPPLHVTTIIPNH